ncbi:efflux RND transporter periplasmic adaptor subunit [Singulisphaera sp. Ch08]|uniref:Efflux RND transporter periplasmic adaptor subunit n=1 Tax=Singulisphaera sp. Ch08 TaxID=3120278 RepID=A0AAU7C7I7_9BACT
MKKLLLILILIWGGGAAGLWYWTELNAQYVTFRTIPVRRGDLLATINATGTLEPQEVVDVGAQIAGEIQSFGPDPRDPSKSISYGTPVEQGTVLARLNDSLLKARTNQAHATLDRSQADVEQAEVKLRQAERDLDRVKNLFAKRSISNQEYDTALTEYESAVANVSLAKSSVEISKANLEEANVNLGYTTIISPVKGVILDRRVNIGQTVIASLNAPSLFLIAKDLSQMEIWASVNETDVGAIHVGQGVRFTVGAFPHDAFRGKVSQIRLNASMSQSVVTYTVVVDVDNTSGKLLPYLTARVQFEVEERKHVMLVPNASLRWQPKIQHVVPESRELFATLLRQSAITPKGSGHSPRGLSATPERGTLWVKHNEFVRPVSVEIGLTDGIQTEISGGDLDEGAEIVIGQNQQNDPQDGATPFLPQLKNNKAKK